MAELFVELGVEERSPIAQLILISRSVTACVQIYLTVDNLAYAYKEIHKSRVSVS